DKVTKFEVSTMSTPTMAGTVAALDAYLETGVQETWDRVRALCRYAEGRFDRIPGVEVASPRAEESRTGLFLFRAGNLDPAILTAYLYGDGNIVVRSVRERAAVRLSLHVYNNEADIDRTADLVERALTEGIPRSYVEAAGHGPRE
ncbi:MAG: aminotransferase class V-fold PLP-dependent enzyme, partial [Dehalococcoidia bacterium]|nr:aminotransferase class V-fold PLP-dependent enzyme [Dehalococcoidia bacterium]